MVGSLSGLTTSPIQRLNAANAFKAAQAPLKEQLSQDISDGTGVINNILEKYNLDEIKDYARKVGEEKLTTEDIKYGVTYGRSVIADYLI